MAHPDIGKLGIAVLEHLVESKLGKKFVKELRAGTDQQLAISAALEATADRLWEKWDDKRIWNAVFNHLPKRRELLTDLREAVRAYYGHPTDTRFAKVLTQILQERTEFETPAIAKAVDDYMAALTEELLLADADFRDKARGLADLRILEILSRVDLILSGGKGASDHRPIPGTAPAKPGLVVGREQDIRELKERLGAKRTDQKSLQVMTAIKGWPGVGKTTVAAALAHDADITHDFPDGILWASLGQDPNVLSEIAAWGRALGSDEMLQAKSVAEAQSLLSNLLRNRRMLLIIDDVWKAEDAIPLNVGGAGCAILITTRLDEVARALAPAAENVYRLKVLSDESALELLGLLAPGVMKQHPAECVSLVQELENLPLALQVAGRLLNAEAGYGFGVIELIHELREGARLLAEHAPADRADLVHETTPTIAALLYQSLDRLDDDTKTRYAYLGVFAPRPATFDIDAMSAVWKTDDPRPTIKALVDRGLLEFEPESGRYQMHALLVMLARSLLRPDIAKP